MAESGAAAERSQEAKENHRSRPAAFRMARVERLRCYELRFSLAGLMAGYMSPPGVGTGIVEPGIVVDGAMIIVWPPPPPAQSHDSPPVAYPPPP